MTCERWSVPVARHQPARMRGVLERLVTAASVKLMLTDGTSPSQTAGPPQMGPAAEFTPDLMARTLVALQRLTQSLGSPLMHASPQGSPEPMPVLRNIVAGLRGLSELRTNLHQWCTQWTQPEMLPQESALACETTPRTAAG